MFRALEIPVLLLRTDQDPPYPSETIKVRVFGFLTKSLTMASEYYVKVQLLLNRRLGHAMLRPSLRAGRA